MLLRTKIFILSCLVVLAGIVVFLVHHNRPNELASAKSLRGADSKFMTSGKLLRYRFRSIELLPENWRVHQHQIIPAAYDHDTFFGYSLACALRAPSVAYGAEVAWTAYKTNEGRGSVFILSSDVARGVIDARRILEISFDGDAGAWFGHEIDIKDADGDGLPDVLVGARFDNQHHGRAYFFDGTTLAELFRKGQRRINLSEIPHTRFDPPADAVEFGFSVVISPHTEKSGGRLMISQQGGLSERAGSVAILAVPDHAETIAVRPDQFIWAADALDFGRNLGISLVDRNTLVFAGSNADAKWWQLPHRSGKAWAILSADSNPKIKTIFDTAELSGQYGTASFDISASLANWMSKNYAVITLANIDRNPLIMSGIVVRTFEESDDASLLFYSPKLADSALGWSLIPPVDVDGDGIDDLIIGAPFYSEGSGALSVISGADVLRLFVTPNATTVKLRLILPPNESIGTFGSKRRGGCWVRRGAGIRLFVGAPHGGRWSDVRREAVLALDFPQ